MITGCYSLSLYCDGSNPDHAWDEFPHQFYGELGSVCRTMARLAGWKIRRDGTALCPKCSGKHPKDKTRHLIETPLFEAVEGAV